LTGDFSSYSERRGKELTRWSKAHCQSSAFANSRTEHIEPFSGEMTLILATEPVMAIDEELKLRVGDVDYVLIPFDGAASDLGIDVSSFSIDTDSDSLDPILFLVYHTQPGHTVTREASRKLRVDVLDRDDVFQPAFTTHIVFYGACKHEMKIVPDAYKELAAWNTRAKSFLADNTSYQLPPGPYVLAKQQVWQPWRVHYEINATFMCVFKLSAEHPGG
jgi:hypothetical protein